MSLTRRDLLELEVDLERTAHALTQVVADRSITAANRLRAREVLAMTDANLTKIRDLLNTPVAGTPGGEKP